MKKGKVSARLNTDLLLTLVVVLVFLGLKIWTLGAKISDENVYLYSSYLFSRGILPYRDFFYAHLPGQLLIYGLLFRLFGVAVSSFKVFHLGVVVGCGLLLRAIARSVGMKTQGYLIVGLWLFSTLVLGTADIVIGVYEAVFFLLLGWLLLIKEKPIWAGVCLFLSMLVRLYVFPFAIGILLYHFFFEKRGNALKALAVWLLLLFGTHFFLNGQFGDDYIASVWRYHLAKTHITLSSFSDFIRGEKFLALTSVIGAVVFLKSALASNLLLSATYRKKSRLFRFGVELLFAAVFQVGVLRSFRGSFLIYYITVIPLFVLLTMAFVGQFVPKRSVRLVEVFLLMIMVLNGILYLRTNAWRYQFEALPRVVEDVLAISTPSETIFGQALVTPLVALESGRDISEFEADTNTQRFLWGSLPGDRATKLATESAVFLQSIEYDSNTGQVLQVDPAFVDTNTVLQFCTPYARYPLEQGFGFNSLVVWECGEE